MDYDFSSRDRGFGRVVLALTLDREKMTERVIVGYSGEVRRRLNDGDGGVYYDVTRPIGSLLINFEDDKDREWNACGMRLRESYDKAVPFESGRWKAAAPAAEWLKKKYGSGEPSLMFAAIRTWETYLNCFNLNHGADLLTGRLNLLYRPFFIYDKLKPWQEAAWPQAVHDEESQVELWYMDGTVKTNARRGSDSAKKRPFEAVAAFSSLMPLISCCLFKLEEWGCAFQECMVCGKVFVARSRHYKLCSEQCRSMRMADNKREYDEKNKDSRLEHADELAYNYWYTRYRKLLKGKRANPEKAAAVKTAFGVFRKEAVRKKNAVKSGKLGFADYENWLYEKSAEADRLMEALRD